MKIISFDSQSGEDWLSWRQQGIGASDISVIMGSNPYSTPLQLWEKKCGYAKEPELNPAMRHGIAHEDIARQWLNDHLQLHLQPVCIEDPIEPYMKASLDGFDFDHQTLVEIKCPVSTKVLDAARINGSVPAYWMDQVQWQIMLSAPKKAILAMWDYRSEGCIILEMYSDTKRIEEMRIKSKEFWNCVVSGSQPAAEACDYIDVDDPDLFNLLREYEDIAKRNKGLSERLKELKGQIADYGDDGNFTCKGYKMTRVNPKGSYDIQKMKIDGVEVEKYLKPPGVGYYRITTPKE